MEADEDGLLLPWPVVRLGTSARAFEVPWIVATAEAPMWPSPDADESDRRLAPIRRVFLDRMAASMDRRRGVRRDVALALSLQVLRAARQPLRRVARYPDQARRVVAKEPLSGGARIPRRRL